MSARHFQLFRRSFLRFCLLCITRYLRLAPPMVGQRNPEWGMLVVGLRPGRIVEDFWCLRLAPSTIGQMSPGWGMLDVDLRPGGREEG
jgi:hypothetical protein